MGSLWNISACCQYTQASRVLLVRSGGGFVKNRHRKGAISFSFHAGGAQNRVSPCAPVQGLSGFAALWCAHTRVSRWRLRSPSPRSTPGARHKQRSGNWAAPFHPPIAPCSCLLDSASERINEGPTSLNAIEGPIGDRFPLLVQFKDRPSPVDVW